MPDMISSAEYSAAVQEAEAEALAPRADIIDILSGSAPASAPAHRRRRQASAEEDGVSESSADQSTSIFSLTVPESDRVRGETFLSRMQSVLEGEPQKLVVF